MWTLCALSCAPNLLTCLYLVSFYLCFSCEPYGYPWAYNELKAWKGFGRFSLHYSVSMVCSTIKMFLFSWKAYKLVSHQKRWAVYEVTSLIYRDLRATWWRGHTGSQSGFRLASGRQLVSLMDTTSGLLVKRILGQMLLVSCIVLTVYSWMFEVENFSVPRLYWS